MIISPTQEEIRAGWALQMKCELKRVALRQCRVSFEGTEGTFKGPFSLKHTYSSKANPLKDGALRIEVQFRFQGSDKSEPPLPLFSVECTFDLDYEIQDKSFQPLPESISAFKDGNAIFNCWPYTREFLHDMASRMELQLPPLPFLRILPQPKAVQAATPAPPIKRRRIRKLAPTESPESVKPSVKV